ncbi:MAG: glucose-1-phosphate adenylyltransferase [Gammaproteobacteria bacterium]
MSNTTLAIILAGGHGSRLQPLTSDRAKPAVPFGGKYRIIDFTLANCLHSDMRRVLVLTQYKSHSLHKHLRDGWSIFNPELGEYITAVPPQMRRGDGWYLGTADAVQQNRWLVERSGADNVLLLSGDHVYRMDYAAMVERHEQSGALLTVGCMSVPLSEAGSFGVMTLGDEDQVLDFVEKPDQPAADPLAPDQALVSMGVYVFDAQRLLDILAADADNPDSGHDFGSDIIPALIGDDGVRAYRFGGEEGRVSADGYWRDVGTLDAYYAANMDLLEPVPPLDLYQPDWPIRSYQGQTAPMRTVPGALHNEGIFINSMAAGGVIVAGGMVQHSILGTNVLVGDEAQVRDSILLGDNNVGDGAVLQGCIVDKGVNIPAGERIGEDPQADAARFTVSPAGIVVVPRGFQFG